MGAQAGRAAEYLRVSTDQQRYALGAQSDAIAAYAKARGLSIVRTYQDAGVSGLTAAGRRGLQQLLADVVGGAADYDVILVYDVSRWGRFQNPDESAHYEYVCRQEGVAIEYCAESFGTDGVSSALLKQVKRVMAAEYSRHLSQTVAGAQRRYAALGLWQGGPTGYGLRRALVGDDGEILAILEPGQHKALASDKVVLVPGPPEEQVLVARIYRLFLEEGLSRTAIVRLLNAEGAFYADGRPWSFQHVNNVLTNPIYAGLQAFGRTMKPLGGSLRRPRRQDWVMARTATRMVSAETQALAARKIANRMLMIDDAEMLARLNALARRRGRLTSQIIKAAEGIPCPATYANRFGSLKAAYELIGYDPEPARAKRRSAAAAKGHATRRRKAHPK
ncbi:recombinase family protein [Phenylobacterium sp.]|uniref:recombinase family protein n=1 Tax=Phenylobacterium sp. TaxID=1871053 RepID=UPI0028A2337C|nr:recombinase family protein [Phenylobacterium sp.]